MTIKEYQELNISNMQERLAEVFDCAMRWYNFNGKEFVKLFLSSRTSKMFENGEYFYILGKSGLELFLEMLFEIKEIKKIEIKFYESFDRSKEYWIGYVLAYYVLKRKKSFDMIFNTVSYEDLEKMYYTLHEADITKFVDIMDKLISEKYCESNLKRIRKIYGCSQQELSMMSNVSLRSIQMYEQRNKNINKASVETVYSLSKALGCQIEDLME